MLIVTLGEQGAQIHHAGGIEQIPAVNAKQVLDPTGCGDAFRGGLLYGIENKLGWATTGRLASLMGALKIEHQGPQNYAPSRAQINERFEQAFGYSLPQDRSQRSLCSRTTSRLIVAKLIAGGRWRVAGCAEQQ